MPPIEREMREERLDAQCFKEICNELTSTRHFFINRTPNYRFNDCEDFEVGGVLSVEFNSHGEFLRYTITSRTGQVLKDNLMVFEYLRTWVDWTSPDFCMELKGVPYKVGQSIKLRKTMKLRRVSSNHLVLATCKSSYKITSINYQYERITIYVGGVPCHAYFGDIESVVQDYYFINTKGEVQETFKGHNPQRDQWLRKTGNYFLIKQDATDYYNRIMKGE